jgi:hypothetical protein
MRLRRGIPALALVAVLTGCTGALTGTGSALPTASPPSSTPSTAAAATGCPRVVYPGARLSFACITGSMHAVYDGAVWPVSERRTVEPATGWLLEEGAGHWGSPDGVALVDVALNVRQQMVDNGSYGPRPRMLTVASRPTRVDGARAYLLRTTFVINRGWARQSGTAVREERLWIVAVEVAANDASLWYVSIPDLVKSLWAKVPATIAAIRVR